MDSMKQAGLVAALAAGASIVAGVGQAADYIAIVQSIDVNRSADLVWKKVGGFCAIKDWLANGKLTCVYTSGTGDLGTDRLIAGRIHEIMVARTDLSYTYVQPLSPIEYHGAVEVKPTSPTTSRIIYTLFYDQAPLPDQAAKDKDRASRAGLFMNALTQMKAIAEANGAP